MSFQEHSLTYTHMRRKKKRKADEELNDSKAKDGFQHLKTSRLKTLNRQKIYTNRSERERPETCKTTCYAFSMIEGQDFRLLYGVSVLGFW